MHMYVIYILIFICICKFEVVNVRISVKLKEKGFKLVFARECTTAKHTNTHMESSKAQSEPSTHVQANAGTFWSIECALSGEVKRFTHNRSGLNVSNYICGFDGAKF